MASHSERKGNLDDGTRQVLRCAYRSSAIAPAAELRNGLLGRQIGQVHRLRACIEKWAGDADGVDLSPWKIPAPLHKHHWYHWQRVRSPLPVPSHIARAASDTYQQGLSWAKPAKAQLATPILDFKCMSWTTRSQFSAE